MSFEANAAALAESHYQVRAALADEFDRWQEPLRNGLETMRATGQLRADADPALLATPTLASIQGGLVLTQTRRDPNQLRVALDAARTYLRAFAP
jgi:TetR/AcrR family transcriptional regulator, transcriptional repressor for nem operon